MTECQTCGTEVPQPRLGRRRVYCSAACRQQHYRQRGNYLQDLGRERIEDLTPGELTAAGVTPYDVASAAIRGGWSNSLVNELAPSTRALVLKADAEYEREGRQQEAERKARGEDLRMRSIVAAVEQAQQRGEAVSLVEELRTGGRNVGRTPSETVAYVSAMQDIEDARRETLARRVLARIAEGLGVGDVTDVPPGFGVAAADSSAPTVQEIGLAQLQAEQQRAEQLERGREIGKQRQSRMLSDRIRTIAQEEIAVDRADPQPINVLLARAQQRGGGRHG